MDNSSDYTLGLQELINRYEGMVASHTPIYFDSLEFLKIHEFYSQNDRMNEAEAVMKKAFELYNDNSEIVLTYAETLLELDKIEEAYEVLSNHKVIDTEMIHLLRGEILLQKNKPEEAEKEFFKSLKEQNYDLEAFLDIITSYTKTVYTSKAEKFVVLLYQKHAVDKIINEDKDLRETLSNYYMLTKQNEKILELAKLETELNPYHSDAWGELAVAYLLDDEYEKAIDAIDFALAIEPDNNELQNLRFSIVYNSSAPSELVPYLQQQIKENKDSIDAIFQLIEYYIQEKEYKEAHRYIESILREKEFTDSERMQLYIYLSKCAVLAGEEKQGHRYALLAIQADKECYLPYINYAWCWMSFEKYNLEIADSFFKLALRQVLKHSSDEEWVKAAFLVGKTCFEKDVYKQAIYYFEVIMDEEEESAEKIKAYPYLIYCYFYEENLEKLVKYLKIIKKEQPIMFLRFEDVMASIDKHDLADVICDVKELIDRDIPLLPKKND